MKLDGISLFQLAADRMQWLSGRQTVIAENIANADTPGFRARDVAPFAQYVDAAQSTRGDAPVAGQAGLEPQPKVTTVDSPDSWSGSISGNTVVLEQQTVKAGETATQYRLAANLYRKAYQILTIAGTGN